MMKRKMCWKKLMYKTHKNESTVKYGGVRIMVNINALPLILDYQKSGWNTVEGQPPCSSTSQINAQITDTHENWFWKG